MEISDFSLFLFFLVALFFHFAGHIYVLVAISRLRPRPLAQSTVSVDSYPNLTFVIPTFNEEQYVEEKLKNALSLDYPHAKMRILLVDGGSHDFTLQRAYAIQNACLDRKLEIYHTDKPGKIGQLNLALAKTSESDVVVVSDCDALVLRRDALHKAIRYLQSDGVGLVGGWTMPPVGVSKWHMEDAYWDKQNRIRYMETICYSSSIVVAPFYAFRRSLLSGGFPDDCVADDVFISFFTHLANLRVIYAPDIDVSEVRQAATIRELFLQKFRKTHAYTIELLRVAHKLPYMGKRLKLFYSFKLFQFFYLPWATLGILIFSCQLFVQQQYNALAISYIFLVIAIAFASLLSVPPPGKTRGGISLVTAFVSALIFVLYFIVMILNFFWFPFWRQNSIYRRVATPRSVFPREFVHAESV